MLKRAGENVGELIIGGILRRVKMGVGGAELRQHGVDDGRRVFRERRATPLEDGSGRALLRQSRPLRWGS